jgi:hypothetical protein
VTKNQTPTNSTPYPIEIWNDMKNDGDDKKYCGGFKTTLELYLKNKESSL